MDWALGSMAPTRLLLAYWTAIVIVISSSSSSTLSAAQHSMTTINFTDLDAMTGVANASFSLLNLNDAKTFWWTELSLVNYLPM